MQSKRAARPAKNLWDERLARPNDVQIDTFHRAVRSFGKESGGRFTVRPAAIQRDETPLRCLAGDGLVGMSNDASTAGLQQPIDGALHIVNIQPGLRGVENAILADQVGAVGSGSVRAPNRIAQQLRGHIIDQQ